MYAGAFCAFSESLAWHATKEKRLVESNAP